MSRGRNEPLYAEWRDRVSRWKASGLSSDKFAAQEGIGRPRALVAWSYKVRHEPERLQKHSASAIRPMRVLSVSMDELRAQEPTVSASIGIKLTGGTHLSVPADERTLRAVFRALGACS